MLLGLRKCIRTPRTWTSSRVRPGAARRRTSSPLKLPYYGNNWHNVADRVCTDMARHQGGSNVLFGDGHAKFRNQGSMKRDDALTALYPNNSNWCYGLIVAPTDPRAQ